MLETEIVRVSQMSDDGGVLTDGLIGVMGSGSAERPGK